MKFKNLLILIIFVLCISFVYLYFDDIFETQEGAKVFLKYGGNEIELMELLVSEMYYMESPNGNGGFVCGDGPRFYNILEEDISRIPCVNWMDELEVYVDQKAELIDLRIYDESYEKVPGILLKQPSGSDEEKIQKCFAELEPGIYYIAISVKEIGRYMEVENKFGEVEGDYEYAIYEYAFQLNK